MSFYRGPHKALFVRLDTALSKRPRIFGSEYLFGRSLGAKLYTNNTQCYMLSFFVSFSLFSFQVGSILLVTKAVTKGPCNLPLPWFSIFVILN